MCGRQDVKIVLLITNLPSSTLAPFPQNATASPDNATRPLEKGRGDQSLDI